MVVYCFFLLHFFNIIEKSYILTTFSVNFNWPLFLIKRFGFWGKGGQIGAGYSILCCGGGNVGGIVVVVVVVIDVGGGGGGVIRYEQQCHE